LTIAVSVLGIEIASASPAALPEGRAIRYGAIVGEDGQAWSGVATVARKEEWPGWTPTEGEKRRLGPLPSYVEGGARNPMGARALYLYAGGKDTLYRIHGTNQPEYIGHAISSGCIRLTNEDVIDLYDRVKTGALVVVLGPKQGPARVASAGSSALNSHHHSRALPERNLRLRPAQTTAR
jgi:lipoprotein-anchoring transpeptidase ErfK/SrfK